ncbi:hypothetical protein WJX79_009346 [Trebouxia sp. C0005]
MSSEVTTVAIGDETSEKALDDCPGTKLTGSTRSRTTGLTRHSDMRGLQDGMFRLKVSNPKTVDPPRLTGKLD